MASGIENIVGGDDGVRTECLVMRRSMILALVGSSSTDNSALAQILLDGFLGTVKAWLNDILKGSAGKLLSPYSNSIYGSVPIHLAASKPLSLLSISSRDSGIIFFSSSARKGGVDLLLHLLSNIVDLPVTKSIVKESGMG